jgi:hypothetical protein
MSHRIEENYQRLQGPFGEEALQVLLGLLDDLETIKRKNTADPKFGSGVAPRFWIFVM